ncbi:MAG: hypothetical protein J6V71_00620 [Clostridia bacterium]|nr:hypothetical protein [Clostridia bacterium]
MNKNTKIILLVVLSMFVPFIGIPLLIIVLLKDKNQEQPTSSNQENCLKENENSSEIMDNHLNNKDLIDEKICNTHLDEEEKKEKFSFKKMIGHLPQNMLRNLILIISGLVLIMILGIILTFSTPNALGKTILMVSAFIEIIGSIIGLVYLFRKERYTCPECGAKRKHHRQFVETKTTARNQRNNTYRSDKSVFVECVITSYRYKYHHTYICPKCGTETSSESWEDGGHVYQYIDGLIVDKRKQPREF